MTQHPSGSAHRVLVVGASSGIGLATALRFAGDGDQLVLVARGQETLQRAADACRAAGAHSVTVVTADVSAQEQIEAAVRTAVTALGRLDVVVHAAAVMAYGTVETTPPDVFEQVVRTTVFGTANLVRAVLPQLRRQGGGTLIVVNSLLGSVTVPQMSAYTTAKWAQRALVRTLQQEVRGEPGIKICMVSPGSVNTPIYSRAANYAGRRMRPPQPVASPEQVGRVIAGLAARPRPHVSIPVGVANPVIVDGFRLLPFVYDRLVGPAFRLLSVTREKQEATRGNVTEPRPG